MKGLKILILVAILLSFSLDIMGDYENEIKGSDSNDKIEVFAIEIPGLHQKDGKGKYDEILKSIPGINFEIKVYPAKWIFELFAESSNSFMSPANLDPEFYSWSSDIKQTEPMGEARIYIFSPKGKPTINSLKDLKGKKIGIRRGMPYGKSFEKMRLDLDIANSIEINIKKLDMGRIDYFVAYIPDAYKVFKKLGRDPYPHDINNPLAIHYDRLVYKGISEEVIAKINESLKKYKSVGK